MCLFAIIEENAKAWISRIRWKWTRSGNTEGTLCATKWSHASCRGGRMEGTYPWPRLFLFNDLEAKVTAWKKNAAVFLNKSCIRVIGLFLLVVSWFSHTLRYVCVFKYIPGSYCYALFWSELQQKNNNRKRGRVLTPLKLLLFFRILNQGDVFLSYYVENRIFDSPFPTQKTRPKKTLGVCLPYRGETWRKKKATAVTACRNDHCMTQKTGQQKKTLEVCVGTVDIRGETWRKKKKKATAVTACCYDP